jgi:hypothetical protein
MGTVVIWNMPELLPVFVNLTGTNGLLFAGIDKTRWTS